jgi:hypothetical protein
MIRKAPSWVPNMLLLIGAILTPLYGLELVLWGAERFAEPPVGQADAAPQIFAQAVIDLRASGVDAYPVRVPYSMLQSIAAGDADSANLLPLSSISGVNTVWCLRPDTEEWVVSPSDEYGFNNPVGIWDTGPVDVMLIGDSFAQGHCVPSNATIAGRLRELGAGRTLSLGLSVNGPLLELASLKEFGEPARPRLTYWLYTELNDLHNLRTTWGTPLLMRYLEGDYSQRLIERRPEVDSVLTIEVERSLRRFAARDTRDRPAIEPEPSPPTTGRLRRLTTLGRIRARLGLYRRDPPRPSASPEQLAEVVGRAARTVEAWGGKFVFVYLPALDRYTGRTLFGRDDRKREDVLSAVRGLGIPILDIHHAFSETGNPTAMFVRRPNGTYGAHFGLDGYHTVARTIFADAQAR